jgi:DNA-binding GntR family transcriptional regulator
VSIDDCGVPIGSVILEMPATDSLVPVSKDTLSEKVYERLARSLMTGEFKPGSLLTLRGIAAHLGTSVMPVREAIRRLMAQHAFLLERNKAIQIPLLSEIEFEQLWRLRELLEGEACAQAASQIRTSELASLSKLLDATLAAAKAGKMRPIILKSHEYFFRIYRGTLNEVLVSMIEMLWLRTGPLYFEAISSVSHLAFVKKSLQNNSALFDALKKGDGELAKKTRQRDLRELALWLNDHREKMEGPKRGRATRTS